MTLITLKVAQNDDNNEITSAAYLVLRNEYIWRGLKQKSASKSGGLKKQGDTQPPSASRSKYIFLWQEDRNVFFFLKEKGASFFVKGLLSSSASSKPLTTLNMFVKTQLNIGFGNSNLKYICESQIYSV